MKWFIKLRDRVFGINKLNYFIQKSSLQNEQAVLYKIGELKALEIIKPYLPQGYLFETGFSMSFQAIQNILNDILVYKPKLILEFGSGLSTQIISKFLEINQIDSMLYSIDDNKEWQQSLDINSNLVTCLTFSLCENSKYSYEQKGKWYDIPESCELTEKKFDLIIVDAPKGSISKFARFGFIPFMKNLLSERAILYIDDSERPDERKIVTWAQLEFVSLEQNLSTARYTRLSKKEDFYTMPS